MFTAYSRKFRNSRRQEARRIATGVKFRAEFGAHEDAAARIGVDDVSPLPVCFTAVVEGVHHDLQPLLRVAVVLRAESATSISQPIAFCIGQIGASLPLVVSYCRTVRS